MNFRFSFTLALTLLFLLPAQSIAQNGPPTEADDAHLLIMRHTIHSGQDSAEICLEPSHAFDLALRPHLADSVRLKKNGEKIDIDPKNLSLTAQLLCVQALDFGQDYDLTLSDLRSADGKTLSEDYKLSFTIPDRHHILSFIGEPDPNRLIHFNDSDPVLRSVNVDGVHLALYRIDEPAAMASAWRQRLQTTLAPSESLTFASTNGQLVWQGDFILNAKPDKTTLNKAFERIVPVRAAAGPLAPGFYFLAASSAQTKSTSPNLGPMAGLWFARSDLRIRAAHENDGFRVLAEKADASQIAKDIHLILLDHERRILVEAQTDNDGLAFLPLPAGKKPESDLIIGQNAEGDVAFADVTQPVPAYFLPQTQAHIILDRPFYPPAATAQAVLVARGMHGEGMATDNGKLQLLRPDQSLYAEFAAPQSVEGVANTSFTVPPVNGIWSLVWQQADGSTLAKTPLRVTSNREAPRIEASADRALIGRDGEINPALKAQTFQNQPAPDLAGHILLQWQRNEKPFPAWADYHFGTDENIPADIAPLAAFITDAQGNAAAHLKLNLTTGFSVPLEASLRIQSDSASGAEDPASIVIPVQPENSMIGIKPSSPNGKFAENSMAQFDIVAIGADSKRQAMDGLSYQIYEEGRSFGWYQTEGRWRYKPLQQHRRIGGGALTLEASGHDVIDWPVTAGNYSIEITNADSDLLAHENFEAGWNQSSGDEAASADLMLKPSAAEGQPDKPVKIAFTLDKASMVNAFIADDHLRRTIHQFFPAGDHDISFTPQADWGNRIGIWIKAEAARNDSPDAEPFIAAGQITLPLHRDQQDLVVAVSLPDHVAAGGNLVLPVTLRNLPPSGQTFAGVLALAEPADLRTQTQPSSVLVPSMPVGADGKAVFHLSVPEFSGLLRLVVFAWNQNQWVQKDFLAAARPMIEVTATPPDTLRTGDNLHLSFGIKNTGASPGIYHYTLNADAGLKLTGAASGALALTSDQQKNIAIDLAALQPAQSGIKLEITGPEHFRLERFWPIAIAPRFGITADTREEQTLKPQQSWEFPARGKSARPAAILIAPQPLFDAPKILATLLQSTPYTTVELAGWLDAARLWQNVVIQSGLMPEGLLQMRRANFLAQLLRRQNADGGFPDMPQGESALDATAAALTAFGASPQPLTQPALDHATGWLQGRLNVAWFDEKERSGRAVAFAALAKINRADISALRYFAETSADKSLPPEAAAALSFALAQGSDRDKAGFWLNAAVDGIKKSSTDSESLQSLPLLAENPLVNPKDLLLIMQKTSIGLKQNPPQPIIALAAFLRAEHTIIDRAGGWRVAIDNEEQNKKDLMVLMEPEKQAITVRSLADHVLFIDRLETGEENAADHSGKIDIQRHIYKANGQPTSFDHLDIGQIYVMDVQSSWGSDNSQPILLHDPLSAALRPVTCALDNSGPLAGAWAWLDDIPLTSAQGCQRIGGVTASITPSGKGDWHLAYLVKAEQAGSFTLGSVSLRNMADNENAMQSMLGHAKIK